MPTTESSPFIEGLWARHTRYSSRSSHTQLARRIYRGHGDRLPMLTALQRRWLPGESAPFGTHLTLPYVQPSVSVDTPSPAAPAVQRRTDAPLVSPRVVRADRLEGAPASGTIARTPGPIATVQRVEAVPRGPVTAPLSLPALAPRALAPRVQRQALPPAATSPTTAIGYQAGTMSPTLPQALSTMPVSSPSPVQRSAVTTPVSEATSTGDLRGDLGATIFNRHVRHTPEQTMPVSRVDTAAEQMIHRVVVSPTPPTEAGSRAVPSMSPAPAILRQAETGLHGGQMPWAETRGRPQVSIMRAAVPSSPAARRPSSVGMSASASPVTTSPTFVSAWGPALGLTLLQRHLDMPQSSGQPRVSGPSEAVSSDRSRPVSPLVLPRSSQTPAEPTLPLARSVDQPVAMSGFDQRPSWPLTVARAHTPLPLAPPLVHGQVASVQRQAEQQPGGSDMTTNMPPSADSSTSTEAAASTAEMDSNQASELTETVWRQLMRRLAVESERRGRQPWS